MKRFLLAFLLSGMSSAVAAGPPPEQYADQHVIALSSGFFRGDFGALNSHLAQYGVTRGFNPYFMTLGGSFVLPAGGRYGEHKATCGAGIILPQQLRAGDSTGFTMRGFYILTSFWSYDVLRGNEKLALEIAPGVHWGSLSIRQAGIDDQRYHNPFIAPFLRTEFRAVLKPLAFGVRALYRYDISSPRWKKDNDESALAHSRMYGPGFEVFVGFGRTAP